MQHPFRKLYLIIVLILFTSFSQAQAPVQMDAGELKIALEKLDVFGSILYLAAHPDDENTALIAYFSKGEKYRTGYLSLTRGDGGQNLIGSEKGAEIGLIRTQELLQARKVDGGSQFFSRAVDFGYTKSEREALKIWGKEDVLSDMVWVIRKFRPDIIVTRFPPAGNGGHGHHTASASLAVEAFYAAADPEKFPDQLKLVDPWKTKRLFWNNWRPGEDVVNSLFKIDVGEYNSLLGKSYLEIAAQSRTMHKSQGFGVSAFRGSRNEYLQLYEGESFKNDIFDGIATSWKDIKGGVKIGEDLQKVISAFDEEHPGKSVSSLVKIYNEMSALEDSYRVNIKKSELSEIIKQCLGLWMEAAADDFSAAPGDEVNLNTLLVNRSHQKIFLKSLSIKSAGIEKAFKNELSYNERFENKISFNLPDDYPISQPYWLQNDYKGLFQVDDQRNIGLAENPPAIEVEAVIEINGTEFKYMLPVFYRWTDRVDGELYRPFEVRPPVTVNVVKNGTIFPDNQAREIQIKLKNNTNSVSGEIHLHTTVSWKVDPENISFSLKEKYSEKTYKIKINPLVQKAEDELKIEFYIGSKVYNRSLVEISYPHIKRLVYFPESKIKLIKLDLKKFDENIGYIMGSGDEIPEALQNLGYKVTLLDDDMLENNDLSQYDVIIAGIRAYNTRERLKYDQPRLMEYVKNGGTYITQYNTSFDMLIEQTGPYPLAFGRSRITDEESPIDFINPGHQLLSFPNKITQGDFENWVQERGLYFAESWDNRYEPVIEGNDPGEDKLKGSILFAKYGKGLYIFSGISWFRELPAGVPGAYRLFINMISAGKHEGK